MEITDNIVFDEINSLASKTLSDGPESKGFTSAIDGLERRNFEVQQDLIQCRDETISFIDGPESSFCNERETLNFDEVVSIDSTDK